MRLRNRTKHDCPTWLLATPASCRRKRLCLAISYQASKSTAHIVILTQTAYAKDLVSIESIDSHQAIPVRVIAFLASHGPSRMVQYSSKAQLQGRHARSLIADSSRSPPSKIGFAYLRASMLPPLASERAQCSEKLPLVQLLPALCWPLHECYVLCSSLASLPQVVFTSASARYPKEWGSRHSASLARFISQPFQS